MTIWLLTEWQFKLVQKFQFEMTDSLVQVVIDTFFSTLL